MTEDAPKDQEHEPSADGAAADPPKDGPREEPAREEPAREEPVREPAPAEPAREEPAPAEPAREDAKAGEDAPPALVSEALPTEPTTVFVSDPSAEAEAVAVALRARAFSVADVPLSMLVARVAVQQPRVILVDADAEGALEVVAKMRELPASESIDVVFLGRPGGTFSSAEDALAHEGSGFFTRPLDVDAVVRKVEALVSIAPRPSPPPGSRRSEPPPSISLKRLSQPPPPAPNAALHGPLSAELESLLIEAEARVGAQVLESAPPTPEEELAAVLPEDVLRALDEPIADDDDDDRRDELDEDDDVAPQPTTSAGRAQETTGAARRAPTTGGDRTGAGTGVLTPGTHDGGPSPVTSAQGAAMEDALRPRVPSTKDATSMPLFGSAPGPQPGWPRFEGAMPSMAQPSSAAQSSGAALPPPPPQPQRAAQTSKMSSTLGSEVLLHAMLGRDTSSRKAESVPPPPPPAPAAMPAQPSVLGPGDAATALAHAIGDRVTGALAFDAPDGVRRIVLRDGDIVTAGSGVDAESLVGFLALRGDLPRDVAAQLQGRTPAYGKNAGAALVAHGLLTQDQLWPVLRAHAEWLVARALVVPRGTAIIEAEPPGRLKTEPNVFGAATGAAVFVEVVSRMIGAAEATEALGGARARLARGAREVLLTECGLSPPELELVDAAPGRALGDLALPDAEAAPMFYALALLGVIEPLRAAVGEAAEDARVDVDALDADAVRARVRARRSLVDDGDYFAVLGVPRSATGYEVRRAFLDLRRDFEPGRILRPELADLADDVRTIVAVLEEAYEILRDPARRERYRRAIDASPS